MPTAEPKPALVPVVACVIEREGKYLLAQRKPIASSVYESGLWEFPGGKVEKGELLSCAAERELREELGLITAVAETTPLFSASSGEYLVHFCRVVIADSEQPQALEHEDIEWVEGSKLIDYRMHDSDAAFTEFLLEDKV